MIWTLQKAKEALGWTSVTVSEATLLSLWVDKNLTEAAKKQKMEDHFTRVSANSRDFGIPVKKHLHPVIVSISVGHVLS